MTSKWPTEAVGNCLKRLSLGPHPKLQTRHYKQVGKYPIVDQGQSLVAGWTDDDQGLISSVLPVIVFGDHTRTFKYVDFPFVRGADGTQILKPRRDIHPRFFYYACRAIDLPSRGYNRHFKGLKEEEIPLPSRVVQNCIAYVLHRVDEGIVVQDLQIATYKDLKRATMQELFTRGLHGEAQKETEIGPMPESWIIKPINEHFSVVSGGTPSRKTPAFWTDGTIPWVKTTEVNYGMIRETEERITQAGLDQSAAKLLPPGTLLLAMYGQGVTRGKVAILDITASCNQACAAINPDDDVVDTKYLYYFLSYCYEEIRQLAHGGQQQNLNLEIVRALSVAYPGIRDEQHEIIATLDPIDRKIDLHRRKRAVLDDLFKALLRKLMTGEISASQLNLPPSPSVLTDTTIGEFTLNE
ncbi:MAG: restriction endonuclease subunit S [Caldilineaceae bacterium]|nr:restriction endonuclease subunit S [Caldilineaceae bacterium]